MKICLKHQSKLHVCRDKAPWPQVREGWYGFLATLQRCFCVRTSFQGSPETSGVELHPPPLCRPVQCSNWAAITVCCIQAGGVDWSGNSGRPFSTTHVHHQLLPQYELVLLERKSRSTPPPVIHIACISEGPTILVRSPSLSLSCNRLHRQGSVCRIFIKKNSLLHHVVVADHFCRPRAGAARGTVFFAFHRAVQVP